MIEDTQWSNGTVLDQVRYVNYYRSLTSGASEPAKVNEISIRTYPNPSADHAMIAFDLPGNEPVEIQVYDLNGHILINQGLNGQEGLNRTRLETATLSNGLYVVELRTAHGRTRERLVVQHN